MTNYERIYGVVRKIPKGRVATYGQIAALAGMPGQPRQAGYALSTLSGAADRTVPWHRVINAKGEISARSTSYREDPQQKRLENEGVVFDARGRTSLLRFQWKPKL